MTTLPGDDDHYREVYARFGLAVYHAQVLEVGMANVLTVAEVFPDPSGTREKFDAALERHFRRNFGQLRARLVRHLGDDEDLVDDLQAALPRRNFLVHRYWYDRVHLMVSAQSRDQLIEELDGFTEKFSALDARVGVFLLRYARTRGMTREDITRTMEEQVAQWIDPDPEPPEGQGRRSS